jgi:micrococcal nuclease
MRTASGRVVLSLLLFLSCHPLLCAQQKLTAAEAKLHVGQQATVCGSVAGLHFASRTKGEPTFINLDKPYPNQVLTIVIWGNDRSKFGSPAQTYFRRAFVRDRHDNPLSRRA